MNSGFKNALKAAGSWPLAFVAIVGILVLFFTCDVCSQEVVEYHFPNPGLGGMVSSPDLTDLQPHQASYLLNADVSSRPGILKRRQGLEDYGTNNVKLYGAYGYYNLMSGHKLVVGVTDHATYGCGQVVVSDTFGTDFDSILGGTVLPWADTYHDWTPYEDATVHADGKSIPFIFTTTQGFRDADSHPDTVGYQPHLISMGLEAPGQPRVMILDSMGPLHGKYVYAFAYGNKTTHTGLGIESAPLNLDGECVLITCFPHVGMPGTKVAIFRKQLDGQEKWYFLDTVYHTNDSHVVYIDTLSDTLSTGHTASGDPVPGAIFDIGWTIDTVIPPVPDPDTISGFAYVDSIYYIAYSFYDPVTGIESPLGPPVGETLTTIDTNMVPEPDEGWYYYRKLAIGYIDTLLHPKWVRFYQRILQTDQPGGGDTSVWYGLFEMRPNDHSYLTFGQWEDTNVVAGLDTAFKHDTIHTYELLHNYPFSAVKTLPPYNYDCQIPFSDIEYFAGQLWGIGDPDYPNRVYYSQYDWPGMNIFSWPLTWFVQIRELGNDKLVAIERAEGYGRDALYAIAHNSVWLINENADYQIILPEIGSAIGAASRQTVVKNGSIVYFLSPGLRIYALKGTQLVDISAGIENYIESVFVNYDMWQTYQGFYCWGHSFGDYVRWFNDSTGLGVSFDTRAGVWSLERYGSGNYVPRGSFVYDTLPSSDFSVGLNYDLELLYMDSTVPPRRAVSTAEFDAATSGSILERAIQFAWNSGQLGDGVNYWEVQELNLKVQPLSIGAMHYAVYDEYGNSLCSDSLKFGGNNIDTVMNYRLHLPHNNSLHPSMRIFSNDTDTITTTGDDPFLVVYYHNFQLLDVKIKARKTGVGNVQ